MSLPAGANLIVNSGFESWTGTANGPATFTGWTQEFGTTWVNNRASFPLGGMPGGGTYYALGGNGDYSRLSQTISLSGAGTARTFDFSAWLGATPPRRTTSSSPPSSRSEENMLCPSSSRTWVPARTTLPRDGAG